MTNIKNLKKTNLHASTSDLTQPYVAEKKKLRCKMTVIKWGENRREVMIERQYCKKGQISIRWTFTPQEIPRIHTISKFEMQGERQETWK